jgi:hypothetical protein
VTLSGELRVNHSDKGAHLAAQDLALKQFSKRAPQFVHGRAQIVERAGAHGCKNE